jgi:LacI family transcriptional regulator, galactose operon repressor
VRARIDRTRLSGKPTVARRLSYQRVTVHHVADHAGVSPITVSRVINESPNVRVETRQRVQNSISALGYVPDRLARALKGGRTGLLGLIVPELSDPPFALIARGVEDVAWRADYHLLLCNSQRDVDRERSHVENVIALRVEGVLIAPVDDRSHLHLGMLERSDVSFVLVDGSTDELGGVAHIEGQGAAATRQLISRVISPRQGQDRSLPNTLKRGLSRRPQGLPPDSRWR